MPAEIQEVSELTYELRVIIADVSRDLRPGSC